jgi:integrase/predicted RNA-binding Zn-ribbon protein involved in translation (DUF1610 family)
MKRAGWEMAEESGREKPYQVEDADVGNWVNPQPPKSRPENPEKSLKCPECGSERLYRDGLRRLADGSQTQRWLCRECGFRFSERRVEKPGGKDLKSGSALNLNRRVGAPEGGVENSAGTVRVLMEEKADAEKRAAGATVDTSKINELLFNYAWSMKVRGYSEATIEGRVRILKRLVKLGADLENTETVKNVIAKQPWSLGRKELAVEAYDSFAKWVGIKWEKPSYRRTPKIPFIPLEREIDDLVAGCQKYIAAFLQLLKETGARAGETFALKWEDVDFETRTVRIAPEKGGEPRIFRVSIKLLGMLNALPKTSERIFGHYKSLKHLRKCFERQRKRIAQKLSNTRLLKIHFHTIRHWKATIEYAKTRDILHVMRVMGHKNIKNTLIYTHLVEGLKEDEFICKVARTPEEIAQLIEAGFEYVCEHEGLKFFKKMK